MNGLSQLNELAAQPLLAMLGGLAIGLLMLLGALAAVAITNRAHYRRLALELRKDEQARQFEKQVDLRKETYLAMAESIAAGVQTVMRFADLGMSQSQVTAPYMEKAPAIERVYLVSGAKTANAIAELSSELDGTILRLSAKRLPLMALVDRITDIREQVRISAREREAILALIRESTAQGTMQEARWQSLESSLNFAGERLAAALEEKDRLEDELKQQRVQYIKECCIDSARVARLVPAAIMAARNELELPIAEDAYVQIMQQAIEKTDKQLLNLMDEMEEQARAQ